MKKIIAITGPIGAGKSEAARIILKYLNKEEEQATLLPLAFPIKDIATRIGWNKEKDRKGRALVQDIGTAGRKYRQDIWIKIWESIVHHVNTPYIICDDVRYKNELAYFKQGIKLKQSLIIYIHHPLAESKRCKHPSEQLRTGDMPNGSKVIFNRGPIERLESAIVSLLEEYFEIPNPETLKKEALDKIEETSADIAILDKEV